MTEHISNGTFTTNLTGWTKSGTWSVDSGWAKCSSTADGTYSLKQTISLSDTATMNACQMQADIKYSTDPLAADENVRFRVYLVDPGSVWHLIKSSGWISGSSTEVDWCDEDVLATIQGGGDGDWDLYLYAEKTGDAGSDTGWYDNASLISYQTHTDTVPVATVTLTPSCSEVIQKLDEPSVTITLSPAVTDVLTYNDTSVSATVTLTPSCQDTVVIVTDFSMMLGDDDGNIYRWDDAYRSDNGTAITSEVVTKQADFSDQPPKMLDRWKTISQSRLWYIDTETDTDLVLYVSTNGGSSWTLVGTNTVGAGLEIAKSTEYYKILTGQYFNFKIVHSSASHGMQLLGMEVFYDDAGQYWAIP